MFQKKKWKKVFCVGYDSNHDTDSGGPRSEVIEFFAAYVMPRSLDRRSFLEHSCLIGGSLLTCIPLNRSAHGAPVRIDAPVIDELTVREITDNSRQQLHVHRITRFPTSRT